MDADDLMMRRAEAFATSAGYKAVAAKLGVDLMAVLTPEENAIFELTSEAVGLARAARARAEMAKSLERRRERGTHFYKREELKAKVDARADEAIAEGPADGLGMWSATGAGGASTRLTSEERVISLLEELKVAVTEIKKLRTGSTIEVAPSCCTSGARKQIEGAVGVRWNYVTELHAPCCSDCKPWSPQPKFCWGTSHEDAKENVVGAVPFLQNIAPEGVMVLPVQTIEWLSATVHLEDTSVIIKSSKTDYIFIPEAAWVKCQEDFGAELFEGWKLRVKAGMTTTDALLSMFGSIIGLYEAKTEKSLNAGLLRVRAQALLEYLAVNHMKDWPTNDVIVMFGDLNRHYVVHAGRKDAGKSKGSIHVASPAQLPAVAEHAPTTAEDGSPESVTLGFIRALLGTRRTDEAGSRGEGAANSRGAGASGSGGGASGSGGGASGSEGGASSSGEGASGSGGGASGSGGGASGSGGGAANSRGGGVSRNGGGANGSGDAGADGGSIDAYSGSRADSSGGEGSCSSCADSPDGGVDGDEGLREAARENAYAQACMSLLRLPEVYEPMGLTEPPTSFRPATKEEYLARFRPV